MIAKFKKGPRKRSIAAVLVLAVLACITLTDAYPDEPPFIFGTPTNLGPTVNSSDRDGWPTTLGTMCWSPWVISSRRRGSPTGGPT